MGTAELSHDRDQKRQHDPDRPGEIAADQYAVYFHCQTDLVETFRELYPTELRYGGNRSILLDAADEIPGRRAAPLRGAGADLSSAQARRAAGCEALSSAFRRTSRPLARAIAGGLRKFEISIRVLRGPLRSTNANSAAACEGCSLTQPCEAGTAEPRQIVGAVNGEAVIKEDRVRHRRIVIFAREITPRHRLRMEHAARRAVAAAAGRDRPVVSRRAVDADGHALR